jgi:hypothetical protein
MLGKYNITNGEHMNLIIGNNENKSMQYDSVIESFDCAMTCTLLGLTLDRQSMKSLAKKYHAIPSDARSNPYLTFYGLHHACHSKNQLGLRKSLENLFDRRYSAMKDQLVESDGMGDGKQGRLCHEMFRKSPTGTIWAMLSSQNESLRKEGVYYVHRVLLRALELYVDSQGKDLPVSESKEESQCLKISELTNELNARGRVCAVLKTENRALEQENISLNNELLKLRKRPDETSRLKREIRKLQYEMNKLTEQSKEDNVNDERNRGQRCSNQEFHELQVVSLEKKCCDVDSGKCKLEMMKVAVVGGMDRLAPRYCDVIEEMGGEFLSHNGDCSGSRAQVLAQTVCKADIVVYITSMNSHNALHITKATCKKSGSSLNILCSSSPSALKRLLCEKSKPRCNN